MTVSLARVILYVHDVERLSAFYREAFAFEVVEVIAGEWTVLKAGPCELALHRVGAAYRGAPITGGGNSNATVLVVDRPIAEVREALMQRGVPMVAIKSYGNTGPLCDGRDPEGNVFQLSEGTPGQV